MTHQSLVETVLQKSSRDIYEYLTGADVSLEQGQALMRVLKEENVPKYEAVLATLYGVGVHLVGTSCFAEEAPDEEHDKWFISVLVGSELDRQGLELPLCDSEAQGYALAVERYDLTKKFFDAK